MCYFITGIYSGPVTLDEINAAARKYNFEFFFRESHNIQRQLKTDEIYILKAAGCDCDTPLGSLRRLLDDEGVSEQELKKQAQELQNLRKKGWGEAKIQRYLDDKEHAGEKQIRKMPWTRGAIEEWMRFLKELFENTAIRTFGLLIHFYYGDNEDIHPLKRRTVPLPDLTEDTLLMMEDDILYVFTRH